MKWPRLLAVKITALLAVLIAAFGALSLTVHVMGERGAQAEIAADAARIYAGRIAEMAALAGSLDHPDVRAAIGEAARQDYILHARLSDSDGNIVFERGMFDAEWTRADANLTQDAIWRGEAGAARSGVAGHVAAPVMVAGRIAGAVSVTAEIPGAGSAAEAALRRSLIAVALGFVLLVPAAGLYLMWATRPLRRISMAARKAARGRLDERLDMRTGDEIQDLAEGVNAMMDRLKGSLEHVRQLAYADHLTGLPNQTAFMEHSRAMLREGCAGAVFLIDLDRFKRLNDTFGAKQGDRLIRMTAQRIQTAVARHEENLRAAGLTGAGAEESACGNVLARITADEFALLVTGAAGDAEAENLATGILRAIEQPIEILGQHVVIACSIGIAHFPRHGEGPELLLRNANLALDEVKKIGGAGYRVFDEGLTQAAMARVTLEHELRRAIERDEFSVYYQPKISARSGALTGVEALVRWRHPDGTLRAPGSFIQVAEETGLIAEMGGYVLAEACRAAARWRAKGYAIPVSVNVSALQFERPDFRQTVETVLAESDLPAELLELEITESVAMTDPERALAQIEPLRRLGVRFAIDDFGTGHSSLAHLTRMPFDTFKIDQSFVRVLGDDPNARVIVQTILALARSLRLDVVAEGAETAEQVAMLQSLGCNIIQGYYFARPMPEAEMTEYARKAPLEETQRASAEIIAPFSAASSA